MSESESAERFVVADTVVVNYFLAVGAFELLRALVGGVVQVPRAVFDPDESDDVVEDAASELRRGLWLHRRRTADEGTPNVLRERSRAARAHFESLPHLAERGQLIALDLTDSELDTFAQLRDPAYVSRFSLIAGLGAGEAAALAIAIEREYALATDDTDAIKVATSPEFGVGILRIRGLLKEAVAQGSLALDEARAIHRSMVAMGFWDRGRL